MVLILLEYGGIAIGTEEKPRENEKKGKLVDIGITVLMKSEDMTPENTTDKQLEEAIKEVGRKKDELASIEYRLTLVLGRRRPSPASSVSKGEGYPS